ncbi:hypothetical protein ACTXT7_002940 [Hymenolepis weldensis]
MPHCGSLGVMTGTCLGICVQIDKHSGTTSGHYIGDLIASQSFLITSFEKLTAHNMAYLLEYGLRAKVSVNKKIKYESKVKIQMIH